MISKKQCRQCKYRSHINGVVHCNYILIKKRMRRCYEGVCDKFEKGAQIEEHNF